MQVEFCSGYPPESAAAARCRAAPLGSAEAAGSAFVWLAERPGEGGGGGGGSAVGWEAAVAALREAGLPMPSQILQVCVS